MESLRIILAFCSFGTCIFFAFFCGFRCKQAGGTAWLNDTFSEIGGGSFLTSIISRLARIFWGGMCVVSVLAGFITFLIIAPDTYKTSDMPSQSLSYQPSNPVPRDNELNDNIKSLPQNSKSSVRDYSKNSKNLTNDSSINPLSKCDGVDGFFAKNDCYTKVCAIQEYIDKDECYPYKRKSDY